MGESWQRAFVVVKMDHAYPLTYPARIVRGHILFTTYIALALNP